MGGIKVRQQRYDFDCALTALGMLLDVPYGDVALVAKEYFGRRRDGYWNHEIQTIAAALGTELVAKRKAKGYLDHRAGILTFHPWGPKKEGHAVVLSYGMIIDPADGRAYRLEDYLKREKHCKTLLWRI